MALTTKVVLVALMLCSAYAKPQGALQEKTQAFEDNPPEALISDDLNDCYYHVYTRENPDVPDLVIHDYESLEGTHFKTSKKTVFLMHGYTSGEEFAKMFVPGKYFETQNEPFHHQISQGLCQ